MLFGVGLDRSGIKTTGKFAKWTGRGPAYLIRGEPDEEGKGQIDHILFVSLPWPSLAAVLRAAGSLYDFFKRSQHLGDLDSVKINRPKNA